MSHAPTTSPTANVTATSAQQKPSLAGTRIKQRKGQAKAASKFEPEAFRDALLLHLNLVSPVTTEALVAKLVQAGSTLEFLRYAEQLFELLFVGGLLQPGGSYLDGKRSPVYILESEENAAASPGWDPVKGMVEVLKRVIQRYKYLQKPLEENFLPDLIGYLPKWDEKSRDKLAEATALLILELGASSKSLQSLTKEPVVKNDVALQFFTVFCRTSLAKQSVDQVGALLRRSGMRDILFIFPVPSRNRKTLEAHFKAANLQPINDWYARRSALETKETTTSSVAQAIREDESNEQIIETLKMQQQEKPTSDADMTEYIWLGLMEAMDFTVNQPDAAVVTFLGSHATVLEAFCNGAKAEVGLINAVQVFCYSETRVLKAFPQIIKVLYNADVISDQAIIYWYEKGAKPDGKQHFLTATKSMVDFLKEQEDESDEE